MFAFSELEPWKVRDGTTFGGAYTEIIRELSRRLGLRLRIDECPLKRCLLMVEQGQADILIGVQQSAERERGIRFLKTPYRLASAKVFFVRKGQGAMLQRYEDLTNLRIGVKLGAEYFDRFDNDPALYKESVTDPAGNFRKLLVGRLDAVILPEDQGEYLISKLGLREKVEKASYRQPDGSPRSVGISRQSRHIGRLAEFESAMEAMAKDGTLAAIYRREYFAPHNIPVGAITLN